VQYRNANGGADPSAEVFKHFQGQADSGARTAAILSFAMAWGFGISGTAKVEGQFYVDKLQALNAMTPALKAQGTTAIQQFAAQYPDASRLNWTLSVNDGKLEATVNATDAYYKYKNLMQAHPDAAWWIAGPANQLATLPKGDPGIGTPGAFSQSAYNQQMTEGLRRRYTTDELISQEQIAMGQGLMDQFNRKLDVVMKQNGITNLNSKAAGGLSVMKASTTLAIRAEYPLWANDLDHRDTNRRLREIQQIADVAMNPKVAGFDLYNRPDIAMTRNYLIARQATLNVALANGIVGWQTSQRGDGSSAAAVSVWPRPGRTKWCLRGCVAPTLGIRVQD